MKHQDRLLEQGFDPTFLFIWKGMRTEDEKKYHSHDHFELGFIMSGKGRQKIEGEIYEVAEGDLLILNEGVCHQALLATTGEPLVEFYIGITNLHFPGLPPNTVKLKDGGYILHTNGELKLKITKLCVSMEAERDTCRCGKYYMLKTYAMQLLLLVLREQEEPDNAQAHHQAGQYAFKSVNRKYVVERIIDYFEDHYAKNISLDQIAVNMYLSPFYISRIFKEETGDTPIRYLINIRLEKAKEILTQSSELSIQEVAQQVGYEDAYHFSKLFKKKFGIAPSGVRKGEKKV